MKRDQPLLGEVPHVHRVLAGELMLRRQSNGQILGRERQVRKALRQRRLERKREVEASGGQQLVHVLRRSFLQSDLDVRVGGGELREQRRDVKLAAEQHRPDVDLTPAESPERIDLGTQRGRLGEHRARAGGDELTGLGRLNRPGRPTQQLDPKLGLERAHLV